MVATKNTPWPKPKFGFVPGVELFSVGNRKGENYTLDDLRDVGSPLVERLAFLGLKFVKVVMFRLWIA